MSTLAPEKKKPAPPRRSAPELIFGDLWEFDPAPETADPKLKARYELFIDGAFTAPRTGMGRSPDQRASVKLSPITLAASAEVRLRRLAPGATYQADQHRLLLPVAVPEAGQGYAPGLVRLLSELVPRD